MYLINISLKPNDDDEKTASAKFSSHVEWFTKYFDNGTFLMLGPYLNKDHTGVIIAQVETREELEKILSEDVYHPLNLANYEINEFKPIKIASNIADFAKS